MSHRGELQHRCQHCQEHKDNLSICSGCKVVRYCSKEHQTQDWPKHKASCKEVKKGRTKVEKEEHAIRNARPDFMTPANAFETDVGHFWGIHSTRPYMRARYSLVETIHRVGTLDGVTEALGHMHDLLRLCRSDNMGVRYAMPCLMLQLDQDQECYDFIKRYETEGQRGDYDWGNMDLAFLDVKNANVLESVNFLDHRYGDTPRIAAILLLKMKLLVDIINIKLVRKVLAQQPAIPSELWKNFEASIIRSKISSRWVGKR
jgi:hypothetical protein